MKRLNLLVGLSLVFGSISYAIADGTFTGAATGNFGINPFNSFIVILSFVLGIVLLATGNLEQVVEKKDSRFTKFKRSLAARTVGAAILGGAGAYGGHQAGEYLQPYARPVERAYNIGKLIMGNLDPFSSEYNKEVAKKYLSEAGVNGKEYLLKRDRRDDRAYLKKIEESLRLLEDSAGNATHNATDMVPGLKQGQNLKDEVYTQLGKILGVKDIGKRSEEKYRQNYNALVIKELNALIRLNQVNGRIDSTLNQLAMKAAKPERNREALAYLSKLSREANTIYGFLEGDNNLSVDQIYSGDNNAQYAEIRDIGQRIKGADYPFTDSLPLGGALVGATAGAYLGLRRRKIGDAAIATGKYAAKAGRMAAPHIKNGARYMGKKARQVEERIRSRRKIK